MGAGMGAGMGSSGGGRGGGMRSQSAPGFGRACIDRLQAQIEILQARLNELRSAPKAGRED